MFCSKLNVCRMCCCNSCDFAVTRSINRRLYTASMLSLCFICIIAVTYVSLLSLCFICIITSYVSSSLSLCFICIRLLSSCVCFSKKYCDWLGSEQICVCCRHVVDKSVLERHILCFFCVNCCRYLKMSACYYRNVD
jgi:hypothetical protein